MIEITTFEDLNIGDTILVEGLGDSEVIVVEIEDIQDDMIIPKGFGGIDYTPANQSEIVRIGKKDEEPCLFLVSQKMHVKLTKDWQDVLNKS